MISSLLKISSLSVEFPTPDGPLRAVDDLDLEMEAGEALGIVGESGSGKTLLSLSVLGLVPAPGAMLPGSSIEFQGTELVGMDPTELRKLRGNRFSMIFQEPMTSLNPVHRVGAQIGEVLRIHQGMSRRDSDDSALELLAQVGMPDPKGHVRSYPHQLSGGMRQRAMIAMALAAGPDLLIADEPTTALDVTVQAQILDLVRTQRSERAMGLLMVTHDIGVMASVCDRVLIMHEGKVVETGPVEDVLASPQDPYTKRLLAAVPRLRRGSQGQPSSPASMLEAAPDVGVDTPPIVEAPPRFDKPRSVVPTPAVMEVEGLAVHFPGPRVVKAVADVALRLRPGEAMGLVGESGCGKSTLARALVRLIEPTAGSVVYGGVDVRGLRRRDLRTFRRRVQIVFQDPSSSLNPRMTVRATLEEVLAVHGLAKGANRGARVAELLELVALSPEHRDRFPHELSGGQRQRVGIARALAVEPELLICDEAVSALDVSVQAQVLDLLRTLQHRLGLTYLFISHDLAVVRSLCQQVAVMYLGRIVESGPVDEVFESPAHPYTQALLSAVPAPYAGGGEAIERIILGGDVPSSAAPPKGCAFHPRCFHSGVADDCRVLIPPPKALASQGARSVACHRVGEGK